MLQDLKHQESIPTEKGIKLSAEKGRHLCHKNTWGCVCNIFYWANIKSSRINQTLKRHLEDLRIQKINSGVQRLLTPPSIKAAMNTLKVSCLLPKVVKKTKAMNSPNKSWAPAADTAALPAPAATSAAGNIFSFGVGRLNNPIIAFLWVKSRLLFTPCHSLWVTKLCFPLAAHKFCHHLYLSVIPPRGSFPFVFPSSFTAQHPFISPKSINSCSRPWKYSCLHRWTSSHQQDLPKYIS